MKPPLNYSFDWGKRKVLLLFALLIAAGLLLVGSFFFYKNSFLSPLELGRAMSTFLRFIYVLPHPTDAGRWTGWLILLSAGLFLSRAIMIRRQFDEDVQDAARHTASQLEEMRIAKAVSDAQERERLHLGQELHDNVNQILAFSSLVLGAADDYYPDWTKVKEMIGEARTGIDQAITEIRKLSHELAPGCPTSLKEKVQELLDGVLLHKKYVIHFEFDDRLSQRLDEGMVISLYRILQEQLSNIVKYADAEQITVVMMILGNTLHFRIQDDGRGFDTGRAKEGMGLNNIRRRVESLGGKLVLNAAPGSGCSIITELPVETIHHPVEA